MTELPHGLDDFVGHPRVFFLRDERRSGDRRQRRVCEGSRGALWLGR